MIYKDFILQNYEEIKQKLSNAVFGRRITLLAVSKGQTIEKIKVLIDQGHFSYGENKVQEAKSKWEVLKNEYVHIKLHLIGALQTNKAEEAVRLFDVIESLDRMKLVDALIKAEKKCSKKCEYFIQVNIGKEPQKAGVSLDELPLLFEYAHNSGLRITGLMCIPPEDKSPAPYFALMRKLSKRYGLENLSMGMSSDYELALSLGSTEVRVGTLLFGERRENL